MFDLDNNKRLIEERLERLHRMYRNQRKNTQMIILHNDYFFLERLAMEALVLREENDHLKYRLNDEIENDYKCWIGIRDLEKDILTQENIRLRAELEQLKKDKEV